MAIFKDASVLSPHYVPSVLPFREEYLKKIKKHLRPALNGKKPRNLFIYGKTGTGKTSVVNHVAKGMNDLTSNLVTYLNCRVYNSRYRVLHKVLKAFAPELEKSGFGLPFLYEKLIELGNAGKQLVIVLDEIDMVKDLDDLVYTLTRSNDEIIGGGVTLVGISNKLSFKETLDARSKSSLYESEIIFPPYTADQLRAIIAQRCELGFVESSITQSAINLVSAIAAQESGDARYALKLLYKSAEVAEEDKKETVDEKSVEKARQTVEIDLAAETIATLPVNHKIVLGAITNLSVKGSKYDRLGEGSYESYLLSGEVYEEYEHLSKSSNRRPRSARWFREYLNDLEVLGLIISMPSSKGIRGHTTLIKLGYPPKELQSVLEKFL